MPALAPIAILSEFQQQLIGNWQNQDFGNDDHGVPVGGPGNPLSYNIMPLPESSDPDGYILKNFKYHEKLHFNNDQVAATLAVAARAPNRGGQVNQNFRAVFYEQQVMFAEGPGKDTVVHVENGAWLWFPRYIQQPGPYPLGPPIPPGTKVSDALQQQADVTLAKQISIPHGNSILALGSFDTVPGPDGDGPWKGTSKINGRPNIPDGTPPYPDPRAAIPIAPGTPIPPVLVSTLNVDVRYSTLENNMNNYQNPHSRLTQYPNRPLQEAVSIIQPDAFMHCRVTTEQLPNGKGVVTNVPFERQVSRVTDYIAEYWMLFKGDKKYLAYTQIILMKMMIPAKETERIKEFIFPHITCNTVTFCD